VAPAAAFITVSVTSVLLMPRNSPATTTPATSTALCSVQTAIATSTSAADQGGQDRRHGTPALLQARCDDHRGDGQRHAQPKNTSPTWCAFMFSGNSVYANSVKKPKL
jgi:hypothetical protein